MLAAMSNKMTFATYSGMPPSQVVDIDGVQTIYHATGSGEPIVFIYGGNFGSSESASSAYVWSLNLEPLSKRHRVIAFDKLGQGFTANPITDADYTMAAVVRHAAAFINALQIFPVHLVGHSRGGFAAARIALEYPQLVKSLTVVSSGTLSPTISTNDVTLSPVPHPPFSRESARWVYERYCFRPESVTEEWIDACHAVLSLPKYRESVAKMLDKNLGTNLFLPQLARQKRETLTWLREGRLQRPTQFIWGENDKTVSVDGVFDLFDLVAAHQRHTAIHIFNATGHFAYREHPDRFNALLDAFVSRNSEGFR